MSSLGWKINRIKAMSLNEIIFRVRRSIQTGLEKKRIHKGWQPKPSEPVKSSQPLFSYDLPTIQSKWQAAFGEFEEHAYAQALSKVNLFAHFDVDIAKHIDWHLDPDTGVRSPLIYGKDVDYRDNAQVGNCKTLWELSRHKHLVPLAVAYVMTGKPLYADKIIEHIDGWITQNPYGMGVHWCSSLEVSLRLIAWGFTHHLMCLRDARGLFDRLPEPERFGISVYQHVFFIANYLSLHSSANNHLIGELSGIWTGCNLFDLGEEGKKWADFAQCELESEARKQVFEDGVSREQATYYHLWVTEYFLLNWLIGERYDKAFEKEFADRISKMTQFLKDLQPKLGRVPQIGDSDDGIVLGFDPENTLNPYDDLFLSYSWLSIEAIREEAIKNRSVSKAFWYKAIADFNKTTLSGLPVIRDEINERLKVYPKGGYAIIQDEELRLVFDAGPLGYPSIAAHGHADALSFCLALNGEWWIVDPGTYCYHTNEVWRNYFRGTGAHNTVMFENTDQSLIGGAFLWLKHARVESFESKLAKDNVAHLKGTVIGYDKPDVRHERTLTYRDDERIIRISDTIESVAPGEVEVRFHFHPDVNLELQGNKASVHRTHSWMMLSLELDENLDWTIHTGEDNPPLGWYSETLGVKYPSSVLVGTARFPQINNCRTSIAWSKE